MQKINEGLERELLLVRGLWSVSDQGRVITGLIVHAIVKLSSNRLA